MRGFAVCAPAPWYTAPMPLGQTTTAWVSITTAAVPPLPDATPVGDITSLLTNGHGSGKLEFRFSSDTTETVTDVRVSLREDDEYDIASQAGLGDIVYSAIAVTANKTVKFLLTDTGRPTHAVLSGVSAGVLTAQCKRVEP